MLDRMYKEYPAGTAPPAMENLRAKIRTASIQSLSSANTTGAMQQV